MSDPAKCSACEEPIEEGALVCLVCGTRQVRPGASRLKVYLGLALFAVLETYCIVQANTLCLALAAAGVLSMNRLTPKSETKRRREMADNLLECRNFESAKLFLGCDGKSGLAIDRRRKRICLLTNDGKKPAHRIVSHRDILAVELLENGLCVATASRQLLRSDGLVARARTQPVDVVAALTGKPMEGPLIWQVSLRITVRNSTTPPHEVAFLADEVAKGGAAYGKTNHTALSWFRMVDGFIQRAELEEIRARDGFRDGKRRAGAQPVYR